MKKFKNIVILVLLLSFSYNIGNSSAFQGTIPTPKSVIGFQPGESYKLANWDQLLNYFSVIDKASDKIEVHEVGKTEMGNPMIIALISSPENLKNKDAIKEIQAKLADPRKTKDSELAALTDNGKTVVLITASLHGTEVGASQMSPILAYELATKTDDVTKSILDNVMIVLFPSANPDGVMMIADHYNSYINKGEKSSPPLPKLYSKYTGHDNNRDWYMLTQNESKIIADQMYNEWHPEIVFDMHQMGNSGARFFLPPFADPLNPLINPLIVRQLQMIGGYFSSDLVAGGYPWVENMSNFSMWWHGGMRTSPYFHNMIGILSEAASADLASPVQPNAALAKRVPVPSINYPVPWKHDRPWTVGDIVEQDRIAAFALLKAAARNKDMFLTNYYNMNKQSIEGDYPDQPFAYVMPADQHDAGALQYFLEIMLRQDTDFHKATADFNAGGKSYKAGSIIAYLAQPARAHVEGIFGIQDYLEEFSSPYDIVGWTLPLQMGVDYDRVDRKFSVAVEPYTAASAVVTEAAVGSPKSVYIGPNSIYKYKAVNTLLEKKHKAKLVTTSFTLEGETIEAGSVEFQSSNKLTTDLKKLTDVYSLDVVKGKSSSKSNTKELKAPKIAMLDNPSSMPIGWMRWLLEEHKFDYTLINKEDLNNKNLNNMYDVILVTTKPLKKGQVIGRRAPAGFSVIDDTDKMLQTFAENGGTLVSWAGASSFAIELLGLDIQEQQATGNKFNIPGSVVRIEIETGHPMTYGMQKVTSVFFRRNMAWNSPIGTVLGRYPTKDVLVSGFIAGEKNINNTPGIIYDTVGKGDVLLINFEPTFRAQPVSTFKLIFNAIFNSTLKK